MKVDGQLYRAQLECRTSDLANTITGAIWYRTDTGVFKIATGSGYLTASTGAVDNSSLQNVADVIAVKAGGVTNAMLAGSIAYSKLSLSGSIVSGDIASGTIVNANISDSASITQAKFAAVNSAVSSDSGTFHTANDSNYTAVFGTNMPTLTVVNTRHVVIMLVPSNGGVSNFENSTATTGEIRLYRDSTVISTWDADSIERMPNGGFVAYDNPGNGTYRYEVKCNPFSTGVIYMNYWKLVAYTI